MNSDYTSHKATKLGEQNLQQKAGNIKPFASKENKTHQTKNKHHSIVRNGKKNNSSKLISYIEELLRSLVRLTESHGCQDSSASGFGVDSAPDRKQRGRHPQPALLSAALHETW